MGEGAHTHLYRLLGILILAGGGFLLVKHLMVPEGWDFDHYYRVPALEDLKEQPLRIGGNASCGSGACHAEQRPRDHDLHRATLAGAGHRGLACENCHGPLAGHVNDGSRAHRARLRVDNGLCLDCHRRLVSRPKTFPQFDEGLRFHKLLHVTAESGCVACHDPHAPA